MRARVWILPVLLAGIAGGAYAQSDQTGAGPAALLSPVPAKRSDQRQIEPSGTIETTTLAPISPAEEPAEPNGEESATDAPDIRVVTPKPFEEVRERFRRAIPSPDDDGTVLVTPNDPEGEADETIEDGTEFDITRRFHRAPRSSADGDAITSPLVVPIERPETSLQLGARLRELDKMTGQTQTFDIVVGQTLNVDRLAIRLDACRAPASNDTHGTMAFLKIWDAKGDAATPVFSGWMFAESPALSALDHPRYDLWVISCTTSDAVTSAPKE